MEPYRHYAREQLIADAIEAVSAWPSRRRRELLLKHVDLIQIGRPLTLLKLETLRLPEQQWAEVMACAAYEPHGVWCLGVHYVAAPAGCQDCALANWKSDNIVGCGYVPPRYPHSGPRKPPKLYLERVASEGALGADGHVSTEELHYQCPAYQPVD